MALNDIYRVCYVGSLAGVKTYNYWHAKQISTGGSESTLAAIFTSASSVWSARWVRPLSSDYRFIELYVQRLTGQQIQLQKFAPSTVMRGSASGAALPPHNVAHVRMRSANLSRRGSGHFWISGMAVDRHTNGYWNLEGVSNVSNFISLLTGTYGLNGTNSSWKFGVLSRKIAGDSVPINPAGFFPYTSGLLHPEVLKHDKRSIYIPSGIPPFDVRLPFYP